MLYRHKLWSGTGNIFLATESRPVTGPQKYTQKCFTVDNRSTTRSEVPTGMKTVTVVLWLGVTYALDMSSDGGILSSDP
jgi:hypothetical protein